MSFDVAVGMSGAELNSAAAAVYHALYPRVFQGSHQAEFQGVTFTVGIDVTAPPAFDISTATDQAFTLCLPSVDLTLSNSVTTRLHIAITAQCAVRSKDGQTSFVPTDVTASPQKDPVQDYLVKHVVVPAIADMLTTLLGGVRIPPIQVAGVPLSAPSVGVVNGYVIAAVNLAAAGSPPPPDRSFPWPSTPFFALLGQGIVQQLAVIAAASASNRFSGSDSGGTHWAGYSWSYSLSLTNPRAGLQGAGIQLQFTLQGGVAAGVEIVYVPISLGFDAHAAPDPAATAVLTAQGSELVLTVASVAPFTIYVIPGTVPTWIFGWLITAIINGVTLSLGPLVSAFLKNIRLQSFTIPSYSVTVDGTTLTLTPVNLTTTSAGGMIALTGSATVIPG